MLNWVGESTIYIYLYLYISWVMFYVYIIFILWINVIFHNLPRSRVSVRNSKYWAQIPDALLGITHRKMHHFSPSYKILNIMGEGYLVTSHSLFPLHDLCVAVNRPQPTCPASFPIIVSSRCCSSHVSSFCISLPSGTSPFTCH